MMVARISHQAKVGSAALALLVALALMPVTAGGQTRHPATASLLVFKGDGLISQGSAVAITSGGHFLTAAHLLRAGDRMELRAAGGTVLVATLVDQDPAADLALLRVDGWRGGVAALALSPPQARAPVNIAGYWGDGLEPERQRRLFGPSIPLFTPDPAAPPHNAAGIVADGDGQGFTFVADLGRGAYGAAILNSCGEVQGIARAAAGSDIDRLWRPHRLQGSSQAIGSQALAGWLRNKGLAPSMAAQACTATGSPAIPGTAASTATTANDAAGRRQAEEKAAAETRKRQEAERKAAAEKVAREQAERDAAATREARDQAAGLANNLGKQLEERKAELAGQERLLSTRTMALAGAGLALVIALLVAILLQRGRRRGLKAAAVASATFPDCRLVGVGTDGAPLAASIAGKALRQAPDGLLVGRNPAQAQIVVTDPSVSRVHVRIRLAGETPMISDAGSAAGTMVDGTPLAPSEEIALSDGAMIVMGAARLRFSIAGGAP